MLVIIHSEVKNFAPTVDTVDIAWEPHPRGYKSLQLNVFDSAGQRVYSKRWDCSKEPKPAVTWDGRLTENADSRTEPYATPLRSPYRIELDGEVDPIEPPLRPHDIRNTSPDTEKLDCPTSTDLQEVHHEDLQKSDTVAEIPLGKPILVEVLYASVEIFRCPWEATFLAGGEWKSREAFLAAKLNSLGYYAGLPGASQEDLRRALKRVHWNHPTLSLSPFNEDTIIEALAGAPELFPALTFADGKIIPEDAQFPAADRVKEGLRLHVEAIGFEADYEGEGAEFEMQYPRKEKPRKQKWEWEPERTNRPLLPVIAVVKLLDRGGKPVDAREAVGAVPIRWRAEEPGIGVLKLVDLRPSWSEPQSFVEWIHKKVKTANGSENCPDTLGGIRTRDAWWTNAWLGGTAIAGFNLQSVPDAQAMENLASVDPTLPLVRGRSCAYFHPSYIGGDCYQLKAWIDFAGLPRARELAESHARIKLTCTTTPIEVWRRVRLAAILGWPLRRGTGTLAAKAKYHFSRAFLDLDISATIQAPAADVLGQAAYGELLEHVWNAMGKSISRERTAPMESVISPLLSADAPFQVGPKDQWTHPYFPEAKVRDLPTLVAVLKKIRQKGKLAYDFSDEVKGVPGEDRINEAEFMFLSEVSKFSGKLLTEQ